MNEIVLSSFSFSVEGFGLQFLWLCVSFNREDVKMSVGRNPVGTIGVCGRRYQRLLFCIWYEFQNLLTHEKCLLYFYY